MKNVKRKMNNKELGVGPGLTEKDKGQQTKLRTALFLLITVIIGAVKYGGR